MHTHTHTHTHTHIYIYIYIIYIMRWEFIDDDMINAKIDVLHCKMQMVFNVWLVGKNTSVSIALSKYWDPRTISGTLTVEYIFGLTKGPIPPEFRNTQRFSFFFLVKSCKPMSELERNKWKKNCTYEANV